jgi:hypothetical protein
VKQYDPFRPDAPIPPDIFDYIGEWIAQIITYVILFIMAWYIREWLTPIVQPYSAAFAHWLVGWF